MFVYWDHRVLSRWNWVRHWFICVLQGLCMGGFRCLSSNIEGPTATSYLYTWHITSIQTKLCQCNIATTPPPLLAPPTYPCVCCSHSLVDRTLMEANQPSLWINPSFFWREPAFFLCIRRVDRTGRSRGARPAGFTGPWGLGRPEAWPPRSPGFKGSSQAALNPCFGFGLCGPFTVIFL